MLASRCSSTLFGPEPFEPLSNKPDWLLGSSWAAQIDRTVVYEANARTDSDRPLLSIVLSLGSDAVGGIDRFLHALLATTVGPYELVVVLSEATPDAVRAVDEAIVPHAQERAYLSANYTAAARIGLRRFVRLSTAAELPEPRRTNVGLASCAGRFIILHDPFSRPLDFGWDRYFRRSLNDYSDLFAVSARCAFDVRGAEVKRVDAVGDCRYGQSDSSIGDHVEIRDALSRGPIIFDAAKLAKVGPMLELFDSDHDLIEVREPDMRSR